MQATAIQSNVDYAVQAKSALAAVERLTAEIEAVPQKTSMCREKWRDYGAALLAQRVLMPSNQQFGQWVKEHGLDQGIAADRIVRSNAIWLAEHFDIVATDYKGSSHHPTHIREACRDAGHDWAGETQHQKERKAKSVRTKAKKKRYSWTTVAREEGINVERGGQNRQAVQSALREIGGEVFAADKESELRRACNMYLAQKRPAEVQSTVEDTRETIEESARARFDKAIAKVTAALEGQYRTREAQLQTSFETVVSQQVEQRIAPELEAERERARQMAERNRREMENFIARRDGIKQAITKKELQLVLNCLHPDRAPADRQSKFAEAFGIVKRLQPYVDSFE